MTSDEAREAAWQTERFDKPGWWPRAPFDAGWNARGRYDAQQIAALVEAIIWMSGADDFAPGKPAHAHWGEIRDGILARALAGQSESEERRES